MSTAPGHSAKQVAAARVVTLEYTLRNSEGQLIDTTDGKEPLSLIPGYGHVFPALEEALAGRNLGERLTVELTAEQAYGAHQPRLVRRLPRQQFRIEGEIVPGMQFVRRVDAEELTLVVTAVDAAQVTVDANHPLAGVALHFDLVITGVRDAIAEELQSGEVQEIDEIYRQPG